MLIHSWWIVVAFLLAAAIKVSERQYEHAFTRLLVALVYLWIGTDPGIELSRLYSRYFILLLAVIESVSYLAMKYIRRK